MKDAGTPQESSLTMTSPPFDTKTATAAIFKMFDFFARPSAVLRNNEHKS
jgi:hypothetical protein